MSWLRWQGGRQGGDYSKLLVAKSARLRFDLYVLRFPTGSQVKMHQDPAPEGFEHHRVNWTLRFARRGGLTLIECGDRKMRLEERRLYRFRPDTRKHLMPEVKEGEVLMVSFGWLKKVKT